MENEKQTIKCVILTMHKENIILPDANVAEIVSVKNMRLAENKPAWFLGEIQWNGNFVPLLSFEAAGGETTIAVNLNTQVCVIHSSGSNGNDDVPFIALVMSGVPHTSCFFRELIKTDDDNIDDHPMIAQRVRINGARLNILDIDAMVAMVNEVNAV